MKIAVDFDGTIVEHRFPQIGKPRPMAFEVLKALIAEGNDLILWSNREGKHLEEAIEFCRQNGLEFYAVNSDYPGASWSGSGVSRKLIADVYIDDKNLGGLPDWDVIYSMLSRQKSMSAFFSQQREASRSSRKHHHHKHKLFKNAPRFIKNIAERCRQARGSFRL